MNRYQSAMKECNPPEGFEERLRTNVLKSSEQMQPQRPYRPASFARKIVLAVIAILLLTITVSAAVIPWDKIFVDRFGNDETTAALGANAFQNVNVTNMCGDTKLTVRQALGDTKTIYIILDITLPKSVPLADAMEKENPTASVYLFAPTVDYYATGAVSWEDIQGKTYDEAQAALDPYHFYGGSLSGTNEEHYDAETNTLTLLLNFSTESSTQDLTSQPLTLLVSGMELREGETTTTLFSGPFLITFQPTYSAQSKTATLLDKDGNKHGKITISPLAFQAKVLNGEYTSWDDFSHDIEFIYKDGTSGCPEKDLGYGGGGTGKPDSEFYTSVEIQFRFKKILDLNRVAAIKIGDFQADLK